MPTIYRKTDKALAEIDTRAHRLVPRLRTALILVDGKRSDDELRPMITSKPDETLATLLEQGFIEVIGEVVAAPAARPRPAPVAEPAAGPVMNGKAFDQMRRDAVRNFTDTVGPLIAEAVALRMEKARNGGELRPLLELASQIIGNSRGASAAEQFAARFLGAPATA